MIVDAYLESATEKMIVKEEYKIKTSKQLFSWWVENWRAITSELISTMFFLFFGCMTCIPIDGLPVNPSMYGALGFGLIVLINVQTFGHLSGAHMNPAVTFAAIIWGKMSATLGISYIIAQYIGAIIGYGLLIGLSPIDLYSSGVCTTQPHTKHNVYQALIIEILLTASLVFINCAVWDPVNRVNKEANSIKFGLTIAGLSVAGRPLTGASMNPARSFAPAIWTYTWNGHWIYWAGPFIGSALAAIFYKYIWLKIEANKSPEVFSWSDNGDFKI